MGDAGRGGSDGSISIISGAACDDWSATSVLHRSLSTQIRGERTYCGVLHVAHERVRRRLRVAAAVAHCALDIDCASSLRRISVF